MMEMIKKKATIEVEENASQVRGGSLWLQRSVTTIPSGPKKFRKPDSPWASQ